MSGQRVDGIFRYYSRHQKTNSKVESSSYAPLIAVIASTWMLSIATDLGLIGFIGFALVFFATLKLMDINVFAVEFKQYDIVAKKFESYAYAFPFIELVIGISILATTPPLAVGVGAFFVGALGTYSTALAGYVEHKDLRTAYMVENSNIPFALLSLVENLMMVFVGLWLVSLWL